MGEASRELQPCGVHRFPASWSCSVLEDMENGEDSEPKSVRTSPRGQGDDFLVCDAAACFQSVIRCHHSSAGGGSAVGVAQAGELLVLHCNGG